MNFVERIHRQSLTTIDVAFAAIVVVADERWMMFVAAAVVDDFV